MIMINSKKNISGIIVVVVVMIMTLAYYLVFRHAVLG